MADKYWVPGGSGVWGDATSTTNWASTSGGDRIASPPAAGDNVFFDSNSGNPTVTVQASVNLGNFRMLGPCNLTLGQNLTLSSGSLIHSAGSLSTSTFNLSIVVALSSTGPTTRTLNLGSGSHTISGNFTASGTNLTFIAGTSTLNLLSATAVLSTQGLTFNNVSFTNTAQTGSSISGANTFVNLTVAGRSTVGINRFSIAANQIISGALTLSAGLNAAARTFICSDVIGSQRQLQVNSFASTNDIDFRDIAITGAASPINGSALRFGNCQGNSGISFPAAKTVWWRSSASVNWNSTAAWAASNGGTASITNFPLAQDTAIFPSSPIAYPISGGSATINAAYNIGTIDMSARTSATMFLVTGTQAFAIYGDLKTGSGVTYTGTGSNPVTFAGRTTQNITSASKVFTRPISIDSPGGTVVLTDDFESNNTNESYLVSGTWNLNGYTATIRSHLIVTGTNTREIAFGGANLVIGILKTSGTVWDATVSTNLTLSGGGTITLQTAVGGSAKTFAGGNYQNYPTINLGANVTIYDTGLTITGSNKFQNITNSTLLGGTLRFTGGQTNEFVNFSVTGVAGDPLTLSSTNTTQTTLRKSTTWFMGDNSTNVIGNTGLTFTAGGGIDYLTVSYIKGEGLTPTDSSASISVTASVSAAASIIQQANASVFCSATVTAQATRVQFGVCDVLAQATVSASATRILFGNVLVNANATVFAAGEVVSDVDASASVVASCTVTASAIRVREANAAVNGASTLSANGVVLVGGSASVQCNAQVLASALAIYVGMASISNAATVSAAAMNGDSWSPDAESNNTWEDVAASSNSWSQISNENNTWEDVAASSNSWSQISNENNTWQQQN